MFESIRKYFDELNLWFVGGMFRAGKRSYAEALYEFSYMLLWSILPFALGALSLYIISDAPNKNIFDLARETYRNGELLVFTISMLAPILYMTLYDPDRAGAFPHKLPISTIVAFIMVMCSAIFALQKVQAVRDYPFVLDFSIALTILALSFRYIAMVYHKSRLPTVENETELRLSQNTFVDESREYFEGGNKESASNFTAAFADHLKEEA